MKVPSPRSHVFRRLKQLLAATAYIEMSKCVYFRRLFFPLLDLPSTHTRLIAAWYLSRGIQTRCSRTLYAAPVNTRKRKSTKLFFSPPPPLTDLSFFSIPLFSQTHKRLVAA